MFLFLRLWTEFPGRVKRATRFHVVSSSTKLYGGWSLNPTTSITPHSGKGRCNSLQQHPVRATSQGSKPSLRAFGLVYRVRSYFFILPPLPFQIDLIVKILYHSISFWISNMLKAILLGKNDKSAGNRTFIILMPIAGLT